MMHSKIQKQYTTEQSKSLDYLWSLLVFVAKVASLISKESIIRQTSAHCNADKICYSQKTVFQIEGLGPI